MWMEGCGCWSVCVVVWEWKKHNAVQIYIWMYLVLFGKPEQTLGFHICTYGECICYVLCFRAWCLGFSWSVVHVKPRAYKLEQGTYHTILDNKTNKQTYMSDSYIIHWQRRVYCICGHGHMCRRHDMWDSIHICITHMYVYYSNKQTRKDMMGGSIVVA